MTETSNYALKQYEGSDYVNVLTVNNPNNVIIDAALKENKDAAVQTANHLKSGSVHAITRLAPDSAMLRFTATANFTTGDTFTVDGTQVTALLPNGASLSTGAFRINSTVLCCLVGTLLTVYTVGQAENIDADTLGGHEPDYFATADALSGVQQTATSAGVVANAASETANNAINAVSGIGMNVLWTNPNPTAVFPAQRISVDLSDYDLIGIHYQNVMGNAVAGKGSSIFFKNETENVLFNFAGALCKRNITIANDGIDFGVGQYISTYGGYNIVNQQALLVPLKIYGIKL